MDSTPLSDAGIDAEHAALLEAAGIETVEQLEAHLGAGEKLRDLEGIGRATERKILDAHEQYRAEPEPAPEDEATEITEPSEPEPAEPAEPAEDEPSEPSVAKEPGDYSARNDEPPEAPEPEPMAHSTPIVLRRDAALGNGDRRQGEVLGVVSWPAGVELREIVTAFRNPSLVGLD